MEEYVLKAIQNADQETIQIYLQAALARRTEFLQGGDILYYERSAAMLAHIAEVTKKVEEILAAEAEDD